MCVMRVRKAVAFNALACFLISSVSAATLPGKPLSQSTKDRITAMVRESATKMREKYFTVAKAKEFAFEQVVDRFADHLADRITDSAANHIGGPFLKGHDREVAHEVIALVINPLEWVEGPVHTVEVIAKLSESAPTQNQYQDIPHARIDPQTGQWEIPGERVQPISPESKANTNSSSVPAPEGAPIGIPPSQGSDRGLRGNGIDHPTSQLVEAASTPATTSGADEKQQDNDSQTPHQIEAGKIEIQPAEQPTITMTPEGHGVVTPVASDAAPSAKESPTPAATTQAPEVAPTPQPQAPAPPQPVHHVGGPEGHSNPMSGAHEIFGGRDKPDRNTPGGDRGGTPPS
jgi:hypothetical protein